MNSKQRILAAMRGEETDCLPCSIYFNSNLRIDGYDLTDWRDHVRLQMDLGADPVISFGLNAQPAPEVVTRVWSEDRPGEAYPLLFKQYQTPAGTLRMGIRNTENWSDVHWDDHSAGNMVEPLIKTADDVDAFAYVWKPPTRTDLEAAADFVRERKSFAEQYGLPVVGYAGAGLATLMFVMSAENVVFLAIDNLKAFQRLAEIDSRTNIERIKLSAAAGADVVKRFGGYEQTNFYNPGIFRQIVAPLLKAEVETAHEMGILIYYRVVTGMEPLLDDIAEVGFDCIEGGEPHLSNCSLKMWRDAFAGKACSWTGISTPQLLGGKDPEAVRAEVRHCAEVFRNDSFILGVTNSIRNHFPWENTLAMIDEWKKIKQTS